MNTEQKCCHHVPHSRGNHADDFNDSEPCNCDKELCQCPCHTEQIGWREEFNRLFIEENYWQGDDEFTKNVAVGNILDFIERTLQAQREADREELVRRIEDLKWTITMDDLHGQVKDGHHYVRVKHVNAKLLALKSQVAALIKDTKPL